MKTIFILLLLLPMLSIAQKLTVGIGYLKNWTSNAELVINKEGDELRWMLYGDPQYKILKLATMYQPHIKPWFLQLKPVVAIGPAIGIWTDRSRSYWPGDDANYSANSPWKKNPDIALDGLWGFEYGTGKVSIELAWHYSLGLSNNYFGRVTTMATLKYKL